MYSDFTENGEEVLRHDKNSYTVKDLKEILNDFSDDDEILVCHNDFQIFPDKSKGSIYQDHDIIVIEVGGNK